jgi:amino acid adenylation domain-containing protein
MMLTEAPPSALQEPLPSAGEMQRRILAEWNATAYPHSLSKCVHELFEEQVELSPDADAVECNGSRLSFRELNERANKVARVLRKRRVGPDTFVGISVERSLEMVIGIYGILKAGGAYVPLDPVYPLERLEYMLRTAKIRMLLTQDRLASRYGKSEGLDVIRLDADWPAISREPAHNLRRLATPDHLIYLIFTSGSTGRPKAAAVYHRGFTNLLLWFVTEFNITGEDRNLLVSSLSFDLTQKNIYAPLIKGGRLYLAPPGPYDARHLSSLMRDHSITLINCTPSGFYPLIEPPLEETFNRLASLRIAFLGGEPISLSRLRPWIGHPSCGAEVANTYGPTECTDICGSYRMTRENLDRYDFVPLGRPIHNVQLAIIDEGFRLCAVGEPGELCVAGAGIGAGYINDPELTAARFIPNPFTILAGPKIYRTGDQARWLAAGVIEFLGRLDHQVKIRGFRVELHEIENVLNGHPAVREAVVVVKKSPLGYEGARLVCYIMPREESMPDVPGIRGYLAGCLPEYMVPAAFHILPKLPLSPNGKVDRGALQNADEPSVRAERQPFGMPGSALEQRIRQIWMNILGHTQFGMDDNFFDIGGNSIQLAQIHTRLQTLAGREFPITELLVHTTVRAVAAFVAKDLKPDEGAGAIRDRALRQREAMAASRISRR